MKFRESLSSTAFFLNASLYSILKHSSGKSASSLLHHLCSTLDEATASPLQSIFGLLISLCAHSEQQHKGRHLDVAEVVDYGILENYSLTTCRQCRNQNFLMKSLKIEIIWDPCPKRWYPSLELCCWKQPEIG